MSIGTTTIAIESNIKAPEIGDAGYIGSPNIECEHIYNEEWGANFYTFGWVYSGLKSIHLITKEIEDFKEFLERYLNDNICIFFEGGEDPDEDKVDWENLKEFSPSAKNGYQECRYKITNIESGEEFISKWKDMLIPIEYELTASDISNFIQKLYEASEIDDSFTNVRPLLEPYEDFGKIRNFIALNRTSKLKISIDKL
jgi:hypothetical protein